MSERRKEASERVVESGMREEAQKMAPKKVRSSAMLSALHHACAQLVMNRRTWFPYGQNYRVPVCTA